MPISDHSGALYGKMTLDRIRDLIDTSNHPRPGAPWHRGANGAAMPRDEDDQDDHFLFNHPERGGNFAAA